MSSASQNFPRLQWQRCSFFRFEKFAHFCLNLDHYDVTRVKYFEHFCILTSSMNSASQHYPRRKSVEEEIEILFFSEINKEVNKKIHNL